MVWNARRTSLPSLKLTASVHLKMDGLEDEISFWNGLFSGANCCFKGGWVVVSNIF